MAKEGRSKRKLDALNEQASALAAEGKLADAMEACVRSLRADETPAAKALFVRLVRRPATYDGKLVRPYLVRALREAWSRAGALVPASYALIASDGESGRCIARAVASWPAPLSKADLFGAEGLAALAADELLTAVLQNTPAAGLDFEHFLTLARRALLLDVVSTEASDAADPALLRFLCALARQCWINEYVYASTAEEDAAIAALRDAIVTRLDAATPVPGAMAAAYACHAPLSSLPGCARLAASMSEPPLAGVYAQQVNEPLQEARLRASMQRLTPIDDAISRLVSRQYEEHPYPRWVRSPSIALAIPYGAFLADELGVTSPRFARRDAGVDVLVAGCGTGQQSIQTARRFASAKILAVDLSGASLAYAKRKTREIGLSNVEYAQADILQMGSLGRTFDLIQCVGVLHHLDDPLAGWRVLRSLLRPGGVMHIGLYSETARREIAAAQAQIIAQGYEATTEGIRRFRLDLQLAEPWRPFRGLTLLEDFYDASGCRDLLFHAKEHRFTLPRIKTALSELDLDFLNFNVDTAVQQRYAQRYPGELARDDLNCWTQFEVENPSTFIGMYNFYAQAHA